MNYNINLSFQFKDDFIIKDGKISENLRDELKEEVFNIEQYDIEHLNKDEHIIIKAGAGAGTGKTKTMIDRTIYLRHKELATFKEMVMITFTNKAANQMKQKLYERLEAYYEETKDTKYLGWIDEIVSMRIQTIHSFAKNFIELFGDRINIDRKSKIKQESSIYKILKSIYNENSKRQSVYYDIEGELQFEYERLKEQGVLYKNNSKSIAEINKILEKKTEVSCSSEIAPIAWLDLDFCPKKFYYSGVLCHNPVYESEFHQKIVFAILGKLFKSQLKGSNEVEKYFYPLFPQWNKTTKDNLIETSYKREIRSEYKFKNIYFPYHMKDVQVLRSKIYENHRRKRKNAYRNMNIDNEKCFNEFIKEDMKYDTVTYIKGSHCDMCPHNMICCKGEFAIERSK